MRRLLESILLVETGRFTIRVWKQEADERTCDVDGNKALIASITEKAIAAKDKVTLAHTIANLPSVNAVEVKDASFIGDINRIGVVLYNDWP